MRKLRRVQIEGRRFGFTYGASWLAIKEYSRGRCLCGDSINNHRMGEWSACLVPDCDCREYKEPKLLSFAVGRPQIINHRTVREIIAERIGIEKGETCKTKKSKPRK